MLRTPIITLLTTLLLLASLRAAARDLVRDLPSRSDVIAGYGDTDSLRRAMASRPLHRVEGIWQFPSDGATVAVERADTPRAADEAVWYRMIVISSPCRSLRPGTLMGHIAPTAKDGVYAARIYTSGDGGPTLSRPKSMTLTLTDDTHLTFREHSRTIHVNLWRLIPYMSRIGLRVGESDAPKDLHGCRRIYPRPNSGPAEPRYL